MQLFIWWQQSKNNWMFSILFVNCLPSFIVNSQIYDSVFHAWKLLLYFPNKNVLVISFLIFQLLAPCRTASTWKSPCRGTSTTSSIPISAACLQTVRVRLTVPGENQTHPSRSVVQSRWGLLCRPPCQRQRNSDDSTTFTIASIIVLTKRRRNVTCTAVTTTMMSSTKWWERPSRNSVHTLQTYLARKASMQWHLTHTRRHTNTNTDRHTHTRVT